MIKQMIYLKLLVQIKYVKNLFHLKKNIIMIILKLIIKGFKVLHQIKFKKKSDGKKGNKK